RRSFVFHPKIQIAAGSGSRRILREIARRHGLAEAIFLFGVPFTSRSAGWTRTIRGVHFAKKPTSRCDFCRKATVSLSNQAQALFISEHPEPRLEVRGRGQQTSESRDGIIALGTGILPSGF